MKRLIIAVALAFSTTAAAQEPNEVENNYFITEQSAAVEPLGSAENVNKCRYSPDFLPTRNQPEVRLDIKSELRNQTRSFSKFDQFKYTEKFDDKSAPVIPSPEVCPIVFNNIPRYGPSDRVADGEPEPPF